jgi:alpha-mannosidase
MLKCAFDVDIHTDKATYDIQFGTIERPTHMNTSWDAAKFEVCAHKYADISEGGYGVSLINDCKYGHDIHDGLIQLSLLKCGIHPSKRSDHGKHSFTYSICPHAGSLATCDTVKRAYFINYPMYAIKAEGNENVIPTSYSALKLDKENVICETVKEAESTLDTIVRLYETKNVRSVATLELGFEASKCYLCDLLENELEELEIKDGKVAVDIKGFEIVTLKFKK